MPAPAKLRSDPRALARELADAFEEHRLLTYASAVAFRSFVALIPLVLLGIALLGATGQQKVWTRTLAPPIQARVLPGVFEGIDQTVAQIFQQGGWFLIAFATTLAIVDVAGAVRSIMRGINEIDGTEEGRPLWLHVALSIGLAVVVIVCLIGAALLVTAGGRIAGASGGLVHFGLGILRWLAAAALLGVAVGVVVNYGAYRPHSKKWVSAGSAFVVVVWVVMSLVFKWFVVSLANFKTGPGVLSAFLVLTTYVYASSIVLLVGVQLDALLAGA